MLAGTPFCGRRRWRPAGGRGRKYLVAYVVPRDGERCDGGAACGRPGARPSAGGDGAARRWCCWSAAASANGKVDRRRLPARGSDRAELATPYVAPRNPVEAGWPRSGSEVLGVRAGGRRDNFFALGGDSIRSIQVLSPAQAASAGSRWRSCSAPPIEELALVAGRASGRSRRARGRRRGSWCGGGPCGAGRATGVEDAYPLVDLQAGMLFHSAYSAADGRRTTTCSAAGSSGRGTRPRLREALRRGDGPSRGAADAASR